MCSCWPSSQMRYDRWNVASKVVTKSLESLSSSSWMPPKASSQTLFVIFPHFEDCCQRAVCFERHFCVFSRHQMKTRVNSGHNEVDKKATFRNSLSSRSLCSFCQSKFERFFLLVVEEKEIRNGFWRPPKRRPAQQQVINFGLLSFNRLELYKTRTSRVSKASASLAQRSYDLTHISIRYWTKKSPTCLPVLVLRKKYRGTSITALKSGSTRELVRKDLRCRRWNGGEREPVLILRKPSKISQLPLSKRLSVSKRQFV